MLNGLILILPEVTETLVKSTPLKKREEKRREENINMGVVEEVQPTEEDADDFA